MGGSTTLGKVCRMGRSREPLIIDEGEGFRVKSKNKPPSLIVIIAMLDELNMCAHRGKIRISVTGVVVRCS